MQCISSQAFETREVQKGRLSLGTSVLNPGDIDNLVGLNYYQIKVESTLYYLLELFLWVGGDYI